MIYEAARREVAEIAFNILCKRNKMLEDFYTFIKIDNGYNLSFLSEQVSKWMSNLYSVLSALFLEGSRLCIAATDKRSALRPWLGGIFTTAIEISPRLELQLKHENLLRSGDSWSPTAANMDGLGWLSPRYLNGTDTTKTRFSFQKRPSRPPRPMAQYIKITQGSM